MLGSQAFAATPGLCSARSLVCARQALYQKGCVRLQSPNGSSACARPCWVCAPSGSLLPTPPRDFGGLAQPCVLPFQPGRQCGGCLAGLPLAEAQVRPCSWPHTRPPQSWADRKIPDIVVQRWLQAGRQREVGAGEGAQSHQNIWRLLGRTDLAAGGPHVCMSVRGC